MTEFTACCAARPASVTHCCGNCDLLVGVAGLHLVAVDRSEQALVVSVESSPQVAGCRACGVVAVSHGRRGHQLIDTPSFGRPVRVRWAKRTWSCPEPACPVGTFSEQDERVAAPRAMLTARACWWAIEQLRPEHASVAGLARQLGTTWSTVWRVVKPLLVVMAADLTRDEHGNTRARLLDLVPGRSGSVHRDWLTQRGDTFRAKVKVATLDPFHGYKHAIDDQLDDATAVVDAVRRRVQQETCGHRGRAGDPLYGIQTKCPSPGKPPNGCGRSTTRTPSGGAVDRRGRPRFIPVLPDPRDRPPRPDSETVAWTVPGLLRHRRRLQRRHRIHQRPQRTPPPRRPRLQKP